MRVLMSGASGLIGSALSDALVAGGHEVVPLRRGDAEGPHTWSIEERRIDERALDGIDAVVHLSGKPIGPPFTASKKKAILDSRVIGTEIIADAVAKHRPSVFVCASAIGYYGDRGDEVLTEESAPGDGFLADVVKQWEAASQPAADAGVRTVNIRTSLVLTDEGDLLKRMSIPFKLGVGGRMGSGRQWWSWITLEDEVRAIMHCLEQDALSGPVNLSAPEPVQNKTFVDALGDALNRPSAIPVPAFALKLALGREAAEQLILASQRVIPEKLTQSGFVFEHPTIDAGMAAAIS